MTSTTRQLARATTLRAPTTANESTRSVELLIATSADVGDGISLTISNNAIEYPDVVPVMLDHVNGIDRMAGRLESIEVRSGQLFGVAVFTDAPAADIGWQLARSGCACSIHAEILQVARGRGDGPDQATKWRLRHIALVPMGMDPAAVTRGVTVYPFDLAGLMPVDQPVLSIPIASSSMTVKTTPADTSTETTEAPETTISRAELKRERDILRAVSRAGFPTEYADELISQGLSTTAAHEAIFTRMRDAQPGGKCTAGHPVDAAPVKRSHSGADLAMVLAARFGVKEAPAELRHLPISRALEPIAQATGMDTQLVSNAQIIERAFSTSDFSIALLAAGERTVLQGYNSAPEGVRALALRRPLDDFRETTMLRLSMFGSLAKKGEGGEYKSGTWSEEEAAVLQADEYGRIVNLTRKALINDDLDIFGRLLMEMGASAARLEAQLLASTLLSSFTWVTANTATATDVASALVNGTLKLRRQVDVSGARVSFEPRVLLVPPELEAEALQVLSDRYMPNDSAGVNPFNVQLAVDAQLTNGAQCYLADSNYPPLALGTIGAPATSSEEKFSTGNRALRVQHDAAAAVLDERSIVRITIS